MNKIDEGRKAELLLQNETFEAAVAEVRNSIMKMWEDSLSGDKEGREMLYRELHGLKAVIARLKATVDAGKIAQME